MFLPPFKYSCIQQSSTLHFWTASFLTLSHTWLFTTILLSPKWYTFGSETSFQFFFLFKKKITNSWSYISLNTNPKLLILLSDSILPESYFSSGGSKGWLTMYHQPLHKGGDWCVLLMLDTPLTTARASTAPILPCPVSPSLLSLPSKGIFFLCASKFHIHVWFLV